ncbi:MAG TPA: ATP-binding cassette domain-containing protein [Peptococcaceae bacterium]|nr:ATP-binding cassette domain-containing protein [Peptococcaceae bacterium]
MRLLVDIKKKLKGFSLEVAFSLEGEYTGILGPSGSGKSMTLKCIAGIETPDEGRIVLNGKVLFDSEKKINLKPQDRNIGYLFQNYALFPHMTVEENIGIGLKLPQKEKKQKVKEMIKAFHLQGLEKKYPNQISGGQQQRVALARCIVYKPDVLMLDEPFSALDAHLRDQLQIEILELLKLYEGGVLLVSHSRDEIYRLCKKLVIIDQGKSILCGDTKEIFRQPKLHAAARIIGCKNISRCEIISSHSVRAVDWGFILETGRPVPENIKYLGIQAHDFCLLDVVPGKVPGKEQNNVIKCKISKIVEGELEYNVYFRNEELEVENGNESEEMNMNSELVYQVRKELWDNRKNKENLYLKIPEQAILLLG